MASRKPRQFTHQVAVRERVPLWLGLMGPSGGGKTYSALRLATGIQRVTGGDIWVVDTEGRRALHYADQFTFQHVDFNAPFDSLSYLDAVQHCVSHGAKVVVIDSWSHEHEGEGGLLDAHDAELDRIAGNDRHKRDKVKMLAWQQPKKARQRMLAGLLQTNINLIGCFRAKQKLKMVPGKQPTPLGWMPIAGPDLVYEMTACALLLPGADGVPTWQPDQPGERQMVKQPGWSRQLFDGQLNEATGERLAHWAKGDMAETPPVATAAAKVTRRAAKATRKLLDEYSAVTTRDAWTVAEDKRRELWASIGKDEQRALKTASMAADARLQEPT